MGPWHSVLAAVLLGASAPQTLSEAGVIERAQAQDPNVLAARRAADLAEAQRIQARLYPNPSLNWFTEAFVGRDGMPRQSEDQLFVSVPVDVSGRRRAQDGIAQANATFMKATSVRTRSDAVVRALELYNRVLAERERARIEARVADWLVEADRIVGRRLQEGRASGYDQARIAIEAEMARSALRMTRARLEGLQAELSGWLGVQQARYVGSLEPDARLALTEDAPVRPRSVGMLKTASMQAEDARGAASSSWIPTLSLQGGPRFGSQDRFGYVAGASLGLPLFSRGQQLRRQADAQQELMRSRADAAERSAHIARSQAAWRLQAARQERERFDEATQASVLRLERAVESGYREGERTLIELLDARRTRTAVEVRKVELALSMKLAEVQLRAALGEFE